VEMQGKVSQEGLGQAAFSFDLNDARIDVREIGWSKPAGEAARATATYSGNPQSQASTMRLVSEDAELDASILLAADGRLRLLQLRRLFVQGQADVSGTVARTGEDGFDIDLDGPYLDISALLGDLDAIGAMGQASGQGSDMGVAFDLDATVDRLRLRSGLLLDEATLNVVSTDAGIDRAAASGEISDGVELAASYQANGANRPASIALQSDDAGFIAAAFLGVDFIEGGELEVLGTLANGSSPTRLQASVRDTRLINAPVFTQILSLASLRGLSDTLSGDGVLFTQIEAPVTIGGGRYVLNGARASGPALGLTVNGWIGTDGEGIELDGVLVPSFGVNSMLGGVPIIGDLIVGRDGEGIFSITYSVSGTLEKAQIAVNPLSAVTPGILRRIFENPSDTSIPESLPVDPDRLPPSAKLPDLPEDEFIAPTPGGGE
ncbi:MAG: AsmA-like C-terminal region-containing protein, partial [Pseudomonadota bacterium]